MFFNFFIKFFFIFLFSSLALCSENFISIQKAPININDNLSLQNGANIYMKNCVGCHSLKYMRFNTLVDGLGFSSGVDIVKNNWFYDGNLNNFILSPLDKNMSSNWFGVVPPDLSLVSRYRGVDWIYTYLKSFYKDSNRTWGVNNLLFPDVSMPHVLLGFQGVQVFNKVSNKLEMLSEGKLNTQEYDKVVIDLVNFLSYVGEPIKKDRQNAGYYILSFLFVFSLFSYMLKKEYWKDIKK